MEITSKLEFAKAIIKTGAEQIRTERWCVLGCGVGELCTGRATKPNMVLTVDHRGAIAEKNPKEVTFTMNACPVIRDPSSTRIG
jgi:hypothetical protein